MIGSLLFLLGAFKSQAGSSEKWAPIFGYRIIQTFPHDPEAYTQGLVFHKEYLYEGTGLLGKSTVRKVALETGKTLKMVPLPDHFFGEGVTIWKDWLVQLTWQSGVGLVYDLETFRLLKKFSFSGEGWGLTNDGRNLIMSDGTDTLIFLDPVNYKEVRRLKVRDQDRPVGNLNELEYIKGEIWANVYKTDWVVRISPDSGRITGWIDFRGLLGREEMNSMVDVLNGIAYDAQKDRIFVTGKYWPKLFEIKILIPSQNHGS